MDNVTKLIDKFNRVNTHIHKNIMMNEEELIKVTEKQQRRAHRISEMLNSIMSGYINYAENYKKHILAIRKEKLGDMRREDKLSKGIPLVEIFGRDSETQEGVIADVV